MSDDRKDGAAGQASPRGAPLGGQLAPGNSTYDRRSGGQRYICTDEVLIIWSHAPSMPVRYRAMDMSEGGMRIKSMLPLRDGSKGTAVSLLPSGRKLNRPFQIVWCKRAEGADAANLSGYEAGLRFHQP